MWEYILEGVTLWGVWLIRFYNGRVTRKEISREIRELAQIARKDHKAIMAGLKEIVARQKEIVIALSIPEVNGDDQHRTWTDIELISLSDLMIRRSTGIYQLGSETRCMSFITLHRAFGRSLLIKRERVYQSDFAYRSRQLSA